METPLTIQDEQNRPTGSRLFEIEDTGTYIEAGPDISDEEVKQWYAEQTSGGALAEVKKSWERHKLQWGITGERIKQFAGAEPDVEALDHYMTLLGEVLPSIEVRPRIWDVAKSSYDENKSYGRAFLDALRYGTGIKRLAATAPDALLSGLESIVGLMAGAAIGTAVSPGPGTFVGGLAGVGVVTVPEALDDFADIKGQGGTDTQARVGAILGGTAIALLNKASAGVGIKTLSTKGVAARLGKLLTSALVEGSTEVLEGLAGSTVKNAVGIPDNVWEALKNEFDVFIPAALSGGLFGAAFGMVEAPSVGAPGVVPSPTGIVSEQEFQQLIRAGWTPERANTVLAAKPEELEKTASLDELKTLLDVAQIRNKDVAEPAKLGRQILGEFAATPTDFYERARVHLGLPMGKGWLSDEQRQKLATHFNLEGKDAEASIAVIEAAGLTAARMNGSDPRVIADELMDITGEEKAPTPVGIAAVNSAGPSAAVEMANENPWFKRAARSRLQALNARFVESDDKLFLWDELNTEQQSRLQKLGEWWQGQLKGEWTLQSGLGRALAEERRGILGTTRLEQRRGFVAGPLSLAALDPDQQQEAWQNLFVAMTMDAKGMNSDATAAATSFFKGPDGKWRYTFFENEVGLVSDTPQITTDLGDPSNPYTLLKDVLQFDRLFQAYPQLRNVPVYWRFLDDSMGGLDIHKGIIVNSASIKDPASLLDIVLHETQHLIQGLEGFSVGANPNWSLLFLTPAERAIYFDAANKKQWSTVAELDVLGDQRRNATPGDVRLAMYQEQLGEAEARWAADLSGREEAGAFVVPSYLKERNWLPEHMIAAHERVITAAKGLVGLAQAGKGVLKGALTRSPDAGKWLIQGYKAADISTAIEEALHYLAVTATGKFKAFIEKQFLHPWADMSGNKSIQSLERLKEGSAEWTSFHESFTKSFLAWLYNRESRGPEDAMIFSYMRDRLRSIYSSVDEILGKNSRLDVHNEFTMLLMGHSAIESSSLLHQIIAEATAIASGQPPEIALFQQEPDTKWETTIKIAEEEESPATFKRALGRAEELLRLDLQPWEIVTLSDALTDHRAMLDRLLKGEKISPSAMESYRHYMERIGSVVEQLGSTYGRGLNTFKLLDAKLDLMAQLAGMESKLMSSEIRLLQQVDWTNLQSIKGAEKALRGNPAWRLVKGIWYNSVLSGPTFIVNFFGNLAFMSYQTGDRAVVGFFDMLASSVTGRPRQVYMSEAGTLARAMLGGISSWRRGGLASPVGGLLSPQAAIAFSKAMFGNQLDASVATKYDRDSMGMLSSAELSAGQLARDVSGKFIGEEGSKKIGELIGRGSFALNIPSRVLRATDILFKVAAQHMSLAADRRRLKMASDSGQLGSMLKSLIDEEVKVPAQQARVEREFTEFLEQKRGHLVKYAPGQFERAVLDNDDIAVAILLDQRARRFAEYVTFQTDPDWLAQRIGNLRSTMPLGWLMVPFVNVPATIMKRGLELVPGWSIGSAIAKKAAHKKAMSKWEQVSAAKIAAGRKAPPMPHYRGPSMTEIMSKTLQGGVITAALALAWGNGDITGPPPEDPGERDAFNRTKMPFAFRVGNNWIQYRNFDPLGLPLGVVTSLFQSMSDINRSALDPQRKQRSLLEKFFQAATVVRDTIIDSTYIRGIVRATAGPAELARETYRTASGFMPYSSFWRTMRKSYEAYQYGQTEIPDYDNYTATFGQSLPPGVFQAAVNHGYIDPRPAPELDIFGRPRIRESSFPREWLPVKWQSLSTDMVESRLAELAVYPRLPGQVIMAPGYGSVRLDEDIYRDYIVKAGNATYERLRRVVSRPGYDAIRDPWRRQRMLQKQVESARELPRRMAAREQTRRLRAQGITRKGLQALNLMAEGVELG